MIDDVVRITRIIAAPREEVFRAWTEPEQIRQWWGPGEFTCPEAEVDLRPGGSYRLAMQPTAGDPFILGGVRESESGLIGWAVLGGWDEEPAR